MPIISKKTLADFWLRHQDAERPLRAWFRICKNTEFRNFAELKNAFGSIDTVGKFTVFDIGGNKSRLISIIHYERRKIYVRAILTHKDYDKDLWKQG